MRHKILPDDEIAKIARKYLKSGNVRLLDPLVASCLNLVAFYAGKMAGVTGAPFDELYSEGCLGLWIGAQHFRPELGRLAPYVALWIRARMLVYVTSWRGAVHWVRTADERMVFFRLARTEAKLWGANRDELAAAIGVPREVLDRAIGRLSAHDVYLDDEHTKLQLVDGGLNPEEVFLEKDDHDRKRERVMRALSRLDPRERSIVEARHMTDEQQTLRSVAPTFGISYERVRQIEEKAMRKIVDDVRAVA